jgi:hypothetical protein
MYVLLFVFLVALFVAFVPGVLVTLPPRGSRKMVLLTHGLLFALVWGLLHSTLSAVASRFNYKIGGGMLEAMGPKKHHKNRHHDDKKHVPAMNVPSK